MDDQSPDDTLSFSSEEAGEDEPMDLDEEFDQQGTNGPPELVLFISYPDSSHCANELST